MSAAVSTNVPDAPYLALHQQAGVATVTMNRGGQFNALSSGMLDALQRTLDALAVDPDVRVIVLAGAGRAFCAGHDLREMRASPELDFYQRLFAQCTKMMRTIQALPQPVIARVHGIATAAGCQLVATCDLAVASEESRFAVSGVNLGLFCSTPSVALSRNVARKKAFEMLVTGDFITAAEACERGLVNRVVPCDRLEQETMALAQRIAERDPYALKLAKASVNETQDAQGWRQAMENAFKNYMLTIPHRIEMGTYGAAAREKSPKDRFGVLNKKTG